MVTINKSIAIQAPIGQVYQFWQNFENFSEFIGSVESIQRTGDTTSHWIVRGPMRTKVEFDAQTTEQVENQLITWHSVHNDAGEDEVNSNGSLHFSENAGMTDVTLTFSYELPSAIANKVAETMNAFGFPQKDFDRGLKSIKTKLETQA